MAWKWFKNDWTIAGFLYFFALLAWGIYFISILGGSLLFIADIIMSDLNFLDLPVRIYIHDFTELVANSETAKIFNGSIVETTANLEDVDPQRNWSYYLASAMTIGLDGIILYGLSLLGRILRSLRREEPWDYQNSKNLKMIGYLMLLAVPYKYIIGWLSYLMINQIQLSEGISLFWPPIAWELGLAGLAVLLVAYIFEEGTRLYKEQRLTV